MKQARQLQTLQAGRGVAALLVVLHHASTAYFDNSRFWAKPAFQHVFDFGHSGVMFFFVLSGFIILSAHKDDIDRPEQLARYASRRFVRVYPAYWMVLVPLAIVYLLKPNISQTAVTAPHVIANSVFLIGLTNQSSLVVAWTLFHEMLFYLMFGMLIWRRLIGSIVMALWFAACAIASWIDSRAAYHFSYLNLLFLAGMMCFVIVSRFRVPHPLIVAALGGLAFICVGMVEVFGGGVDPPLQALGYGSASCLLIFGSVAHEKGAPLLQLPRGLTLLGDASYAIYLIHFPALAIIARLWRRMIGMQGISTDVSFIALVLIAVLAGIAFHLVIERRVLAFAHSVMTLVKRRKSAPF